MTFVLLLHYLRACFLSVALYFYSDKHTVPITLLPMVHTVKTEKSGVKLVNDDNHVYRIKKKYNEKTYWKCEVKQCKARVHTLLEGQEIIIISKSNGEHCHPSNPMRTKVYDVKSKLKILSTNTQHAGRKLIAAASYQMLMIMFYLRYRL